MARKLFYVIYIKDLYLKTVIDGLRLFIDPSQKHRAHLTVRGPYSKIQKQKSLEWNRELAKSKMTINGLGTFFLDKQNTVYLKCEVTSQVQEVWYKKDFKDFNPHITLYNGSDREYAEELFNILKPFNFKFDVEVDELEALRNPIEKGTYGLRGEPYVAYYLNDKLLDELLDGEMPASVENISKELRFFYIKKLSGILSKKSELQYNRPAPISLSVAE